MTSATVKLSEDDWSEVILALQLKAINLNIDAAYRDEVRELAHKLEEIVIAQIYKGGN